MFLLWGIADPAWPTMFNVLPNEKRDQVRAFIGSVPGQAGVFIADAATPYLLESLKNETTCETSARSLGGIGASVTDSVLTLLGDESSADGSIPRHRLLDDSPMKKTKFNPQLFLLPFCLFISACSGTTPTVTVDPAVDPSAPNSASELAPIELRAGYGADGGWIQIYFTNPQSPLAAQQTGGIDQPLADAIDSAKLTVDIAAYSLSLNSIRDALLRAQDRGVQVRMVMESDNLDRSDPQKLKDAGIPILGDRREGLMHNKFTVIDGSEVWVGGMNYTDSGAYEDNNVLMRIRSVKMAENYTKEFEEMFVQDRFGDNVLAETPNPRVTIDGTPVDTYFSPDDGVQAILYDILNEAQESVYFMAFSFTADSLGDAVRARAREGVTVAGVMDEEQVKSNQGTEFDPFRQAGLDVYVDGNERGQMHHKIMIVDENIVIVGSYNFTNSAESRNDENLMVIYDDAIASFFIEEFGRVYGEAE